MRWKAEARMTKLLASKRVSLATMDGSCWESCSSSWTPRNLNPVLVDDADADSSNPEILTVEEDDDNRGPPRDGRNHAFTQVFCKNHEFSPKIPIIHVHAHFYPITPDARLTYTKLPIGNLLETLESETLQRRIERGGEQEGPGRGKGEGKEGEEQKHD